MFKIDDVVMSGTSGICRIVDIRMETIADEETLYYILKPLADEKTTLYCPVHAEQLRLRALISSDQVHELIRLMPSLEAEWIENDYKRKEAFREILARGEHQELVCMIKSLARHRESREREGKKFHVADEKTMKEAEKIIHGEFAYVLDIPYDEVVPFVLRQLADNEERKTEVEI